MRETLCLLASGNGRTGAGTSQLRPLAPMSTRRPLQEPGHDRFDEARDQIRRTPRHWPRSLRTSFAKGPPWTGDPDRRATPGGSSEPARSLTVAVRHHRDVPHDVPGDHGRVVDLLVRPVRHVLEDG